MAAFRGPHSEAGLGEPPVEIVDCGKSIVRRSVELGPGERRQRVAGGRTADHQCCQVLRHRNVTHLHTHHTTTGDVAGLQTANFTFSKGSVVLQCFDAVGWVAGRASGL